MLGTEALPTANGPAEDCSGKLLVLKIPVITSFGHFGTNTFRRRRPQNGDGGNTLSLLAWGSLSTFVVPILRQYEYSHSRLWMSWVFILYLLTSTKHSGERAIYDFAWLIIPAYFVLVCVINYWNARSLRQKLATVVEREVQPLLEPLRYRAVSRITPTGECYSREFFIEIYSTASEPSAGSLPDGELLSRLPRPPSTGLAEPTIVYLHGTPYQHIAAWRCNWSRPIFITDPCPLPNIPLSVWGALQNEMWVERLDKVKVSSRTYLEVWLAIMIYGAWQTSVNWAFMLLFLSPGVFVIAAVSLSYLSSISRNTGHAQWHRAVDRWQDTFAQFGWQMEYHHAPLEATCCTSPDYWLRFVPLSVPQRFNRV